MATFNVFLHIIEKWGRKNKHSQLCVERITFRVFRKHAASCKFPIPDGRINNVMTRFLVKYNLFIVVFTSKCTQLQHTKQPPKQLNRHKFSKPEISKNNRRKRKKWQKDQKKNQSKIANRFVVNSTTIFLCWLLLSKTTIPKLILSTWSLILYAQLLIGESVKMNSIVKRLNYVYNYTTSHNTKCTEPNSALTNCRTILLQSLLSEV